MLSKKEDGFREKSLTDKGVVQTTVGLVKTNMSTPVDWFRFG